MLLEKRRELKAYRIKNWSELYENNRTRQIGELRWVPIPNKHDGDGYTELVDCKNGASMLGCWLAVVQVASKCPVRGLLVRENGQPHTAQSISRQTRLNADEIGELLERASRPSIGWIEVIDVPGLACDCVASVTATSHDCGQVTMNGMEENGIERNGIEEKGSAPASPSPRRRIPNTEHAKLIDHFKQSWEKLHGVEFVFVGGKDGKHFKWILEQAKSLQRAVEIVDVYLADDSQFVAEKFHPVGLLVSQFSVYHAKSATKKPARKVGEKVVNWS